MKSKRKRKIKRNKGKGNVKQDQRGHSRAPKRARNEREMEGIHVASMSHRWGSMSHRCGLDVASMRHRCDIDVASMWIDGGRNIKRKGKKN